MFIDKNSRNGVDTTMARYLIEGGNTVNKGAQAMLLITVQEIKQRDPEAKIFAASSYDYKCGTIIPGITFVENDVLSKVVLKRNLSSSMIYIKNYIKKMLKRNYVKDLHSCSKLLDLVDILIDISGYSLSSDWSIENNLGYLYMIKAAHERGVKVYLMPQSFGPFAYNKDIKPYILKTIKECLPLADVIYAREYEGKNALEKILKNKEVIKTVDLVLQSKQKIAIEALENKEMKIHIKEKAVCIIPNEHCVFGEESYELYREIINTLRFMNYHVYLVYHSVTDVSICRNIKKMFYEDEGVIYIEKDMNCFEYQEMVRKFDFIIASRYHSIIHAYKENTPCVVLGWAVKYKELLELFDQNHYLWSIKEQKDHKRIIDSIILMAQNSGDEREKIKEKLSEYQKDNCFSVLLGDK